MDGRAAPKYTTMVLTVAVVATLVACQTGGASPGGQTSGATSSENATASAVQTADEPDLEKTTLNVGNLRFAALAAAYVADELGYFQDEGLTINFTDMGGGAEGIPALESGALDISHTAYITLLQAREAGLDLVALVTNNASQSEPPQENAVLVRLDDDRIQTPKDLEGLRVGVNNVQSLEYLVTANSIRQDGGDDEAVDWIEIPSPQKLDALVNSQVDAINVSEPFATVGIASGQTRVLTYPLFDLSPGLDVGAYSSLRSFAEENPNTVAAFVRALKRVHEFLEANPVEGRRLLAEATDTDPALMARVVVPVWPQAVNAESLETLVEKLLGFGFITEPQSVDEFVWETAY